MEEVTEDETSEEEFVEYFPEIPAFPKGDLILVVEGKELYVNRQLLTEASPVLRAMLESDFKESTQDRIELPGKSYKGVVEFLKCTYPFLNYNITVNNLFKILPLADEYQTSLKKKCEEFMINILRATESFFIHRTDAFDIFQHGLYQGNLSENPSLIIKYHSDVQTNNQSTKNKSRSVAAANTDLFVFKPFGVTRTDAKTVEDFNDIGFGKNGFELGNTVPAEIVI